MTGGKVVQSLQRKKILFYSLFLTITFFLLFLLSRYNYVLYHTIIEFFAIFSGFSIALISFSTRKLSKNPILTEFGVLYLFVSVIDFLHTVSYKGMMIFQNWSANQPIQFWITGRLLETIGFVTIIFLRKVKERYFALIFGAIATLSVISVFFGIFPDCFVESKGLTSFKVGMEYVIIIALTITVLKTLKSNDSSVKVFQKTILLSILLTMVGEFSFTLYSDVYGFFNFLGHIFRFLSYLVLLDGLIVKSLKDPVNTIIVELENERKYLKQLAYYDQLTGLYSRNFFEELLKKQTAIIEREKISSEVIIIDIDNFKKINDSYGHAADDDVLRFVAECIKESIRSSDIAARYGGDEFVIVLSGTSEGAENVLERIRNKLKQTNKFNFPIDISYGFAKFVTRDEYKPAFDKADEFLYRMKDHKRIS